MENLGWVETFFAHGKRLRSPRRVQSRFRDTRTLPYAYWASGCQSERAPALGENAFWCCVLDKMHRERVNDEIRGRPRADQRSQWHQVEPSGTLELCNWAWVTEVSRRNRKERDQIFTTEARILLVFLRMKDLSLKFWGGDCQFVREFFDFKPAINKNSQRLNRNWRETNRSHSQSKTNDRKESTAGQFCNKESRIILTVITSSNYWTVLINGIGILKIIDESLEKGRNVVSILWLLNIFHFILDSHWLP